MRLKCINLSLVASRRHLPGLIRRNCQPCRNRDKCGSVNRKHVIHFSTDIYITVRYNATQFAFVQF